MSKSCKECIHFDPDQQPWPCRRRGGYSGCRGRNGGPVHWRRRHGITDDFLKELKLGSEMKVADLRSRSRDREIIDGRRQIILLLYDAFGGRLQDQAIAFLLHTHRTTVRYHLERAGRLGGRTKASSQNHRRAT